MCGQRTSAPGLQLLLYEFFRRRKLTELNLGHDVFLADCTYDFRLLLMTVLSLNMDPRDFPNDDDKISRSKCVRFSPSTKINVYDLQLDPSQSK